MTQKKYELLTEDTKLNGKLKRIRALRDILRYGVKKGDLGKGFIEENTEKIVLDETKIYVFIFNGNLYKICKYKDDNLFTVTSIRDTMSYASSIQAKTLSWEDIVKYIQEDLRIEIKVFNNLRDALDWYEDA